MGRLFGAALFGAVAWYTSLLIIPLFPEGTQIGMFREVNTVLAMIAGWRIAGPRAGTGWGSAFSCGITTMVAMVVMVVMALFANSFAVVIERSLRKHYSGPGEVVTDTFALMIEHGQLMMTAEVVSTLFVGCIAAAFVTQAVGRTYS
jgi:hypothetical protein